MADDSSHRQLASALAQEITTLRPGARLASHRALVRRFGVSATTVSDALALLTQQGLIDSRPGAGTFRSTSRPRTAGSDTTWQQSTLDLSAHDAAGSGSRRRFDDSGLIATLTPAPPEVIDLNGGYLHPDLQPLSQLGAALARTGRRAQAWERPAPGGVPELRDWFAASIGGGLSRHDVLVCGAGQSGLAVTMRALCQPGDTVIVESPAYPGTTAAAHAAGLRTLPVPLDVDGMSPDRLDEALGRSGARLIVLQPLFQNPTGISLSPQRGRQLRDVARRHGAFLVEDDFARDLIHADAGPVPPPLVADDPDGVVVHVRSLTKSTSSNLRVGAIAARGPALARLRAALIIETMLVAAPLQYAALELVASPRWRRGLTALGRALAERREAAITAVDVVLGPDALAHRPRGGYHLWAALPAGSDARRFTAEALARGVAVTSGRTYYSGGHHAPHIRLSYVAAPSPADVEEGIRRLAPLVVPAG